VELTVDNVTYDPALPPIGDHALIEAEAALSGTGPVETSGMARTVDTH